MLDADNFEMALLNIVINARDAMPKGGLVTITTSALHLNGDAEARTAARVRARTAHRSAPTLIATRQWSLGPHSSTAFRARTRTLSAMFAVANTKSS